MHDLRLVPCWPCGAWSSSTLLRVCRRQAFRSELCTGFYRVRSTSLTRQAFKHVIFEMATHGHDDKFGDQSATNLVLFEGRFRGLPHEPVVQVGRQRKRTTTCASCCFHLPALSCLDGLRGTLIHLRLALWIRL